MSMYSVKGNGLPIHFSGSRRTKGVLASEFSSDAATLGRQTIIVSVKLLVTANAAVRIRKARLVCKRSLTRCGFQARSKRASVESILKVHQGLTRACPKQSQVALPDIPKYKA